MNVNGLNGESTDKDSHSPDSNHLATPIDSKQSLISEARKRSAKIYLEKREEERVFLFSKKIEDEEALFSNLPITEVEKRRLSSHKKILSTIESTRRTKVDEAYLMPQSYINDSGILLKSKQDALLRHKDASGSESYDQNNW